MNGPLHILILEDSKGDVILIKHQLLAAELEFELLHVETREDFESALVNFKPDIILADYTLPLYDGLTALKTARETSPEIPFIFITGTLSVEVAVETLKQGATDFVLKDHFSRLGQAVKRALEEKEASDKRKEIEEDLLSYRRLFNLSLDLLCIIGFDGKFKKINPVFQSTLGYSEEDILGKSVIDFVHSKDVERTETDFNAQREGKPTIQFENRFLCKNGQYKWLSWTSRPDKDREILYSAARDITDQKQVEMDLRIKDRAISSSSNGLIITDPKLQANPIVYCNPAFEKITGYDKREVLGEGCWFLMNEDIEQEGFLAIKKAMTNGESCKVIVRNYKKDGSLFYNEVRVSPIKNSKDEVSHFVCVFNDITDRLVAEQELRESYRTIEAHVRELEQFAYITSHNLRAPVANIQGLVEIYQSSNLDHDTISVLNQNLQVSADTLDRVIKDLNSILEIRQTSPNQFQLVAIQPLLDDIKADHVEKIKQTKAFISTDFKVSEVYAILPYLRSILGNLIENAMKYRAHNRDPHIEIKTWEEANFACFQIQDNGMGIDLEKNKDSLFGLYKRFHYHVEGKGMGLYMVKNQVEAMGGTIQLESTLGEGSIFTIKLPTADIQTFQNSAKTISTELPSVLKK